MKIKALFLKSILAAFAITAVSALPGVDTQIEDKSGQFVYYRDSSFARESYFGVVYYDEGTYGLRYFAPAVTDTTPLLPKKEISILFTMDSSKDYVELTGERILTTITPEDTDLVNYLHDMIYELTAHRQKAGLIKSTQTISQEYDQFGGNVKITYDPLVPLFNIKSITDPKGNAVFKLVTQGQLVSSKDDNFSAFEGLPLKTEDSTHTFKPNKKAKKETVTYKKIDGITQKLTLDSQWTASAENLYLLDNIAMIAFDVIDLSSISNKNEKENIIAQIVRSFSFGSEAVYPYSENTTVQTVKNTTSVSNIYYNDTSKSFTKSIKVLTKINENCCGVVTLTVFQGPYSRNAKYFDSILKSYKIN